MALKVHCVDGPDPGPPAVGKPVGEQVIALGARPISKAEGRLGRQRWGIWFVPSRGAGPDAKEAQAVRAALPGGRIWRYDPASDTIELMVGFPKGTPREEPDSISAGRYGAAVACTEADDDQWLLGGSARWGGSSPATRNALNDGESAMPASRPRHARCAATARGLPASALPSPGPGGAACRGLAAREWCR